MAVPPQVRTHSSAVIAEAADAAAAVAARRGHKVAKASDAA
jgi:hypothetical protein